MVCHFLWLSILSRNRETDKWKPKAAVHGSTPCVYISSDEHAMIAWLAVIISRPAPRSIQFRSVSLRRRAHLYHFREWRANTTHSALDEEKFDSAQRPVHTRLNNGQLPYRSTRLYGITVTIRAWISHQTEDDWMRLNVMVEQLVFAPTFLSCL